MLKSYPPSELDQSGYIGALAECLAQYPRSIALRCAAINGVAAKTKFRPTVADVTVWCERELEGLQAIVLRDDLGRDTIAARKAAPPPPSPPDKERVAMKCKETLERLGQALGRKTEDDTYIAAAQALERCLQEANSGSKIEITPQLRRVLATQETSK